MKLALSPSPPQASVRRLIRQFDGAACASHPQARNLSPHLLTTLAAPPLLLLAGKLADASFAIGYSLAENVVHIMWGLAACFGSSHDTCKVYCALHSVRKCHAQAGVPAAHWAEVPFDIMREVRPEPCHLHCIHSRKKPSLGRPEALHPHHVALLAPPLFS